MKSGLYIVFIPALLMVSISACQRRDETLLVEGRATQYWRYLYEGEIRAAYDLLDSKSRGSRTYSDYARLVGFGIKSLPEIREYWEAYSKLTDVKVNSVVIKGKTAVVSLALTQPDPTWFPTEANEEATRLGLDGTERGRFLVRAQTEALRAGKIPSVKMETNTRLVKESQDWRVVFEEER